MNIFSKKIIKYILFFIVTLVDQRINASFDSSGQSRFCSLIQLPKILTFFPRSYFKKIILPYYLFKVRDILNNVKGNLNIKALTKSILTLYTYNVTINYYGAPAEEMDVFMDGQKTILDLINILKRKAFEGICLEDNVEKKFFYRTLYSLLSDLIQLSLYHKDKNNSIKIFYIPDYLYNYWDLIDLLKEEYENFYKSTKENEVLKKYKAFKKSQNLSVLEKEFCFILSLAKDSKNLVKY